MTDRPTDLTPEQFATLNACLHAQWRGEMADAYEDGGLERETAEAMVALMSDEQVQSWAVRFGGWGGP